MRRWNSPLHAPLGDNDSVPAIADAGTKSLEDRKAIDEESGEDYALKLTAAGAKAIAVAENPEREHGNDDGGLLESADEPTAPLRSRVLKAPLAEAIEPDPVGPWRAAARFGDDPLPAHSFRTGTDQQGSIWPSPSRR